jgi:diketogulonate reductase-like aldo/keto reductase
MTEGMPMPQIGFGSFQIKGEECIEAVACALSAGYRLIDTARIYRNEKEVGSALKTMQQSGGIAREEVFITSKVPPTEHGEEEAYAAICTSLADLDVEYIDLVLIHWPGKSKTPVQSEKNAEARRASWRALIRAKREGLVRDIGVSNFLRKHLEDPYFYGGPEDQIPGEILEAGGEIPSEDWRCTPAVNQFECHPLLSRVKLREYCKRRGIQVQAYSSLAQCDPRMMESPVLERVRSEVSATKHAVLLAWALQQGIAVIPRSRSPENIRANWAAMQGQPLLQEKHMLMLSGMNQDLHICWDSDKVA